MGSEIESGANGPWWAKQSFVEVLQSGACVSWFAFVLPLSLKGRGRWYGLS